MKTLAKFLFVILVTFATTLQASTWTNWSEYPGDPIYFPYNSSSLAADYYPCVIFDRHKFHNQGERAFYKMWHQGPGGLSLSISNDGLNWELRGIVLNEPKATKATVIYDNHGFGGSLFHYKMWFWNGDASPIAPELSVMFTQSVDGETWTLPVATTQDTTDFLSDANALDSPFHQFFGFGQVIFNPSAASIPQIPLSYPYVAYYDSSAAEIAPYTSQKEISLAYSLDGIHWKRHGSTSVITPSGSFDDWDGKQAYRAAVIKLDIDNLYHMYYSGASYGNHGIGHAHSKDGVTWIKDVDNPIFLSSDGIQWRRDHTLSPTVILVPGKHHFPTILQMWFSGGNSESDKAIGFAALPNPGA